MFNLKNEKLEIFKKFVIGESFDEVKYDWQDFSIESFNSDKAVLNINTTFAFGFLSTDEEYHYTTKILKKEARSITNINYPKEDSNVEVITTNIKSKLIDRISIEVISNTLHVTFRVNVYSRDITYPRQREYNSFVRDYSYETEYVTTTYDVENLSVKNNLLEVDGGIKPILKSVDYDIDLSLFTQLDNLNPRIYLYMYIQLILIMRKNNIGSFELDCLLDNLLITCSMDIKEMFANISNNRISPEQFRQLLIDNSCEKLMFIPLISIYDLNVLVYRRGYFFVENSPFTEEFEKLLTLSESDILSLYGLSNCKGYKVLIRKNLENIYHIKRLEQKGFKYKEVINILNYLTIYSSRTDTILNSRLLDLYLANNSRKDVVKKLFANPNCYNTISDTIKMLNKIISAPLETLQRCNISNERLSYKNIDKYLNFKLNINNLEQEVIQMYNLIDEVGVNLYYSEKDGANSEFFEYNLPDLDYSKPEFLIHEEGEYSLWLPLNSNILKKVGTELSICVGSYTDKIQNQECVVLFVKKGEKCIGCIELDAQYETLIQAKIRYNKLFNEQEQSFIHSFCVQNEIEINTYDMNTVYNNTNMNSIYNQNNDLNNIINDRVI